MKSSAHIATNTMVRHGPLRARALMRTQPSPPEGYGRHMSEHQKRNGQA